MIKNDTIASSIHDDTLIKNEIPEQDTKKLRKEQHRKYGTVRCTREQEGLINLSFIVHSCTTVKEMINMVPQALLVQLAERICISPKQKALLKEENDKVKEDPERLISVLGFKYRKLKSYNEISK